MAQLFLPRFLFAAFALLPLVSTASAEVRRFEQSGFSEILLRAGLEMVVEVGPAFLVTAEGEPDAIDTVEIYLDGATLVVDRKRDWRETLFSWSRDQQRVTLYVTLPMLQALTAQAGAHIEVSGEMNRALRATASAGAALRLEGLDGADVSIIANGGASMMANGLCGALRAEASGGAVVQASRLECGVVTADAMSGAHVEVNGKETLSLGASSGGSVFAHGAGAVLRQDMQSGGSITVKR